MYKIDASGLQASRTGTGFLRLSTQDYVLRVLTFRELKVVLRREEQTASVTRRIAEMRGGGRRTARTSSVTGRMSSTTILQSRASERKVSQPRRPSA